MRLIFLTFFLFGLLVNSWSQVKQPLSVVIKQVSSGWRNDSTSCKGYRYKVGKAILDAQIDSVNREFIFSNLGRPNQIQKFYSGNTDLNYVGYIYFINKDDCPKIRVEGYAIQFVFDESETHLIEIAGIDYCG